MNQKTWRSAFESFSLAIALGWLTGCTINMRSPQSATVYTPPPIEQPAAVYVAPPPQPAAIYVPAPVVQPEMVVEIHADSDFYEPLQAYGRWIDVPGYGRCWTPAGVDPDWRPYADGHWQRTDAGWYWVSDERWGWATYHYGRWHRDDTFGWVWAPQTQWAPAWVAWREGGGYTGWAPLPPEARIGDHGTFQHDNPDPQTFVFVDKRRMLEPQRRQNLIVNNTTIINNSVNITQIVVVNKIVINEGPLPASVAEATGRPVEVVPAKNLRHRLEAAAIKENHNHTPASLRTAEPNALPPQQQHFVTAQPPAPAVRPPLVPTPAQIRSPAMPPSPNQFERPPIQNPHPLLKAEHAPLTPQQKLELEKKKVEARKRLEKAHQVYSTNAPAPPH